MTMYGERLDLDTPMRTVEDLERAADGRGQSCTVPAVSGTRFVSRGTYGE